MDNNYQYRASDKVMRCLIVTVPTPVSDDLKPDLSYVENAWKSRVSSGGQGQKGC